jgi:multidrug resistance efflux pump
MQVRTDANAANRLRLKSLRDEYDTLAEVIEKNEELRAAAETRSKKAEQRLAEHPKTLKPDAEMDAAKKQFDMAKVVQTKKLDELKAQLEALKPIELKAPFDGIVNVVQHREGEAIMASEPILTIAKTTPDNIVAYATEERAGTVRENMKVQLIDRNRTPNALVASHVVYVGPTIEQLPPRLWRNPNVPQYGRPIMINVPAELKTTLVPGAIVGVKGI